MGIMVFLRAPQRVGRKVEIYVHRNLTPRVRAALVGVTKKR